MVKVSEHFTLMIDYAHNAMSLESLLTTLKEYHPKRLVCVFGCGGNRSKTRRYEMGEVSGRLADFTIITSDNPRFEEPQDIIDDIKIVMSIMTCAYIENLFFLSKGNLDFDSLFFVLAQNVCDQNTLIHIIFDALDFLISVQTFSGTGRCH